MHIPRSLAVRLLGSTVALLAFLAATPVAQEAKEPVAGANNYRRIDANFASGGATTAEAFAELKRLGFRYVVNLRTAAEEGADIEGEGETVRKAGMAYLSLPFDLAKPDDVVVTRFLDLAKNQANLPMYVHCRAGHRVSAFLLIKRVQVDGWTTEKALAEWDALGLNNPRLRDYALAYLKARAVR
jgi:uncharacterized protein (TIGR01244 family)